MQRVYYDAQKEYLSFQIRMKMAGKVFLVALGSWNELTFLAKGYYLIWWFNHLPADFTGFLSHAALFGVFFGYCIREARYIYWGYKPRAHPSLASSAGASPLLLPERTPVHITEVPSDGKASVYAGEVVHAPMPPMKQQSHFPEQKQVGIFRIIFSFFSQLTISLKELLSGVCRTLTFDPRPLAMLGYIGWKAKKAAIAEAEVLEQFFQGYTIDSLYHDKMDIKKAVQAAAREFGKGAEEVHMFKTGKGTYKTLALSDDCSLEIPYQMLFWHGKVREGLLSQAADPMNLSEFRVIRRRVIAEYGRGLLEENLAKSLSCKDASSEWAIPDFKEFRTAQLSFLDYCIKREEAGSGQMSDPYHWEECLQQAAWLCKTASFTCATFDPELRQGERFLQRYLQLCKRLMRHDEALETYDEYVQQLQRYKVSWEPSSGTQYLLKQLRRS